MALATENYAANGIGLPNANHKFLIWGGKGWVAGHLYRLLQAQGQNVSTTTIRMEDRTAVLAELEHEKPTHVLNCAGVTGRPNVDWCEDNKEATIRSNVIGTLNLADCCYLKNIHCTVFATGCIYQYDSTHPMHGPPSSGFKESDPPNFSGSFYSHTKARTEALLQPYTSSNLLVLRLRMPVSDDLHARSFVTKITQYERVVDIPNSTTLLTDLLPISLLLATHHELGVYNFTNPGAISHNEVLTLYRDIVCANFSWKNFNLEEQSHVIKAGRSNCMLDTGKLEAKCREFGIELGRMEVKGSMRKCFERMRAAGEERSVMRDAGGSMKGLWIGKENENEERVGGETV